MQKGQGCFGERLFLREQNYYTVKCAQGWLINVDRWLMAYLVRNAKTMVLDINMFSRLNLVSIHSEMRKTELLKSRKENQLGKGREESPLGPTCFQELFYVYSLRFRGVWKCTNSCHSQLQNSSQLSFQHVLLKLIFKNRASLMQFRFNYFVKIKKT